MGLLATINHAINYLAPALWLAVLLPLLARLVMRKAAASRPLSSQIVRQVMVGSLVLVVGLVLFGRDGKMLTYLALVLGVATNQWVLSRR